MKILFRFLVTLSFFAALPSFAAPLLPSGLPSGFASWERPVLMTCAVRGETGGLAEHALELYNKRDGANIESVEIQRLSGEAYLVVYFRSTPQLIGSGLAEFTFFIRGSKGWAKHSFPNGVTADTRKEMFALAEKVYLKPRGLTTTALKKCIRNGNE